MTSTTPTPPVSAAPATWNRAFDLWTTHQFHPGDGTAPTSALESDPVFVNPAPLDGSTSFGSKQAALDAAAALSVGAAPALAVTQDDHTHAWTLHALGETKQVWGTQAEADLPKPVAFEDGNWSNQWLHSVGQSDALGDAFVGFGQLHDNGKHAFHLPDVAALSVVDGASAYDVVENGTSPGGSLHPIGSTQPAKPAGPVLPPDVDEHGAVKLFDGMIYADGGWEYDGVTEDFTASVAPVAGEPAFDTEQAAVAAAAQLSVAHPGSWTNYAVLKHHDDGKFHLHEGTGEMISDWGLYGSGWYAKDFVASSGPSAGAPSFGVPGTDFVAFVGAQGGNEQFVLKSTPIPGTANASTFELTRSELPTSTAQVGQPAK